MDDISLMPPSRGQERLWFLHQIRPQSAAYHVSTALCLHGPLHRHALVQSLNAIVNRHEILRTTFAMIDGVLWQCIATAASLPVPLVDLSVLSPALQQARIDSTFSTFFLQPFELSQGPLIRATLLYLREDEHLLLLALHHIVFDEWSAGILKRELGALYHHYCTDAPLNLPPLTLHYADFAVWQRQRLQEAEIVAQLSYWQTQLAPPLPVLDLPADHPRAVEHEAQGAACRFVLSPHLTASLKTIGRQEGATLFMTLLAAFSILLLHASGQREFVIGTPITARDQPELEAMIGFFLNTLALRINLIGSPSFREVIRHVRQVVLEAYAHQDLPFEQVIDALHPVRELRQQQLFQTMFVLERGADEPYALDGLVVEPIDPPTYTPKFDLTCFCAEGPRDQVQGSFVYDCFLFTEETIQALSARFEHLIIQCCQTPDIPVIALTSLLPAERALLHTTWNATQQQYPGTHCLHQYVEAQADRTPMAIAAISGTRTLTYAEINARSNQLARQLIASGAGPECLVGLCLERSPALLIGLLAILKAGGVYVPLDPAYPQERLRWLLADTGVTLVLTRPGTSDLSAVHNEVPITHLFIDEDALIDASRWPNPDVPVQPSQLAAIIYTSGSTGQPKGVLLTHEALCNRILWGEQEYVLSHADRVLQSAHFSFDFALWECLAPLFVGACVVLAAHDGQRDSHYLAAIIQQQQVTVAHFVPALLHAFLDEPGAAHCTSLRLIFSGGEALPTAVHQRLFAILPQVTLYNQYGPTETAIDITCWRCRAATEHAIVPLGRPIANTQLYLLDTQMQPIPLGGAGELYVGGLNLARGYLGQPGLTAASFVPDPFSSQPGSRLYRTGDCARYLRDGTLLFLGRRDQQVKLHGYRIEPDEISAILTQHPAIQQACVTLTQDQESVPHLVAYVVPFTGGSAGLLPHRIRSFLRERLPHYMIPAFVVILDALPLNPLGKVDRSALPAPDSTQIERQRPFTAPRTALEERLGAIWRELLHLEQVSIYDNFFEIGGDSLLSMRMATQIRAAGFTVTAQQLFQCQTLAELAAALDSVQVATIEVQFPLTPFQQSFLEHYQSSYPTHWNIVWRHFQRTPLLPMQFEQEYRELLRAQHLLGRRCQFTEAGWQIQYIHPEPEVISWYDLAHLPPAEQDALLEERVNDMLAILHAGELVQVACFDLGSARPAVICWCLHPIAARQIFADAYQLPPESEEDAFSPLR